MTSVAQILRSKAIQQVHSVGPNESVFDVVKKMADLNVGALLVVEGSELVGIVSERDYARKIVLMDRSSRQTPVHAIMTTKVLCVTPETEDEECMALMTRRRLRHLPVTVDGKVVGLISIGDLVKNIISEQKFIIDQLEHYISGERL